MRCLISIIIVLLCASPAWGNECYEGAVPFISVPHDRPSTIVLEARRVKSLDGNILYYDLGKETISIQADSFDARCFLRDVAAGRCSAREKVRLEPARKSPFNTRFKAVTPRRSQ